MESTTSPVSSEQSRCSRDSARLSPDCPVLENINEGVITIDVDKKISSFNRAAESITGFRRDEAVGQFCFDIFRADICANKCPLIEGFKSGAEASDIPAFIINKQGDQVPISVSIALLRDERGEVSGAIEIFQDISELEKLRRHLTRNFAPEDVVGRDPRIQEILSFLPDIAESDSPVLLEGPTGTGKELFASATHNLSPRRNGPFIAVNCGALPESLLESELFGYVKGAFTGAGKDKPGRFLLADKGTLFLDEICNTSLAFQADLLRVLEEGRFTPLGDTQSRSSDFRVIASTNSDLREMTRNSTFREDLYYRLNVVKISLPPLEERKKDLPLLIEHFIQKYNLLKGKSVQGVSQEALSYLMAYPFPGNIRELENIIEYAFILCKEDYIGLKHLPKDFRDWFSDPEQPTGLSGSVRSKEAQVIRNALERHRGNRREAADELGISRTTLWRRMKKHGLV